MINIIIGITIIVLGIILDQVVKLIIASNMNLKESIQVLGDFFKITYVKNDGAAFSSFAGNKGFLIFITIVALVIFGYLFKSVDFKKKKLFSLGISFMISGAIGNFIDRIFRGEVVDMFDFVIFGWDFAVFNVADIFLTVGVGLLAIDVLFFSEKEMIKEIYDKEDFDEGIDRDNSNEG